MNLSVSVMFIVFGVRVCSFWCILWGVGFIDGVVYLNVMSAASLSAFELIENIVVRVILFELIV